MAIKNILVSSGDGKVQEIAAGVDGAQLSASLLTINTASFTGVNNGIIQVVNGRIETITGSGNNYKINYDTTTGKFIAESDTTGSLGGDLSGGSSAARVKSVANVTTGILSASYGGTGTGSFTEGALATSNGDGPIYTGNGNKVLAVGSDGNYTFADPSMLDFTPMTGTVVHLYTGSVGAQQTFTWTKPVGARFVRVICQGGGGGGGCGNGDDGAGIGHGGCGGGGGGYSDVTFNALSISETVIITAGSGGLSGLGTANSKSIARYSSAGGSSSFGGYIFSGGGGAGPTPAYNSNTLYAGGAGGGGMTTDGGSGGNIPGQGSVSTDGVSVAIGAPGGGAGANRPSNLGRTGGSITGYIAGPIGGSAGTAAVLAGNGNAPGTLKYLNFFNLFINDIQSFSMPNLMCAGGAGGGGRQGPSTIGSAPLSPWKAGDGSSATFGAGGGGGGRWDSAYTAPGGDGGNGGVGYVLIICY